LRAAETSFSSLAVFFPRSLQLLAWLDPPANIDAAVTTAARRIISLPYLRHFELAACSVRACGQIFGHGKRCILKSLLEVREIFKGSECRYLLNKLYIDEYCVWIQQLDDRRLTAFTHALESTIASSFDAEQPVAGEGGGILAASHTVAKNLVGWELCELEAEAQAHGMHMIGDEEEGGEGEGEEEESSEEESSDEEDDESEDEESDEEEEKEGLAENTVKGAAIQVLDSPVDSTDVQQAEMLAMQKQLGDMKLKTVSASGV
jgi:hypothetical protein